MLLVRALSASFPCYFMNVYFHFMPPPPDYDMIPVPGKASMFWNGRVNVKSSTFCVLSLALETCCFIRDVIASVSHDGVTCILVTQKIQSYQSKFIIKTLSTLLRDMDPSYGSTLYSFEAGNVRLSLKKGHVLYQRLRFNDTIVED